MVQAAKVSCFYVFWTGSVVLVRQLGLVSKWSRPQKCHVYSVLDRQQVVLGGLTHLGLWGFKAWTRPQI